MIGYPYEDAVENDFIRLLEVNPSQEWFLRSAKLMLGDDWMDLGMEVLKKMERKDLEKVLKSYGSDKKTD